MYIRTDRVLYTVKKVIPGKHVKVDPGKKAMCGQRARPILTGEAEVYPGRQPEQPRRHEAQPHAAVLPAVHHRATPITRVERAAEVIAVVSWVGNHRLAARAASEHILTRRASSNLKKVRPAARGVPAQKALHVVVHLAVAAGRKAVPEIKKGVRLPTLIS